MHRAVLLSIFLLPLLIPNAYASVTLNNTNIEMIDSNLNITQAITMESLIIEGDGITTRFTTSDDLRKYSFDRTASSVVYDVEWQIISSDKAQFNVTSIVADARGNVTGTILDDVELDDVSVAWTFDVINIISIDAANKVEYFFSVTVTPTFNTITLSLNSPLLDRLGGVFAVSCPANSTLTGLLTNGTFVCTLMSDFFP